MSDLVKASIAAQLAGLEQSTDFPVEPFGYGSDISADSDLDEDMNETDPFSTLGLAQALVRRLDCPRGALPDDRDYGIDLRSYVNRGMTDDEIRELAGAIRAEVTKDDRVDLAAVTVSPDSTGTMFTVVIAVTPVNVEIGEFTLTLSATSAEILIEEIRAAA